MQVILVQKAQPCHIDLLSNGFKINKHLVAINSTGNTSTWHLQKHHLLHQVESQQQQDKIN